ncbi:hypothetical protein IZU94_07930 [Legionella sp. 27fs60]|nr:hypothetical protein [Legionella bononiensis]
MQASCRFREIPHCVRDDVPGSVILNEVKDLQIQALCLFREVPHCVRDNISRFRHPERSEGPPNAGTMPVSGGPSLCSG